MSISLPMADQENFAEVSHQEKKLKVGDRVVVQHAGEERVVEVSSISKKQGHYWVGYDDDIHFCPWPLVRLHTLVE